MNNIKVIVSLTSHTKERLKNVPYFLYHSILKHGFDYVKVVLTLWKDDIPLMPDELRMMIDSGLVELIEAEQDLKCNLKYFYKPPNSSSKPLKRLSASKHISPCPLGTTNYLNLNQQI